MAGQNGRDDPGICILLNPGAGQAGSMPLDTLLEDEPGIRLHRLKRDEDIRRVAEDAVDGGFTRVVAAGGDGTVVAVAEGVHGTDASLGVLPLGTFNYFARGAGIPLDIEEALEVVKSGRTARVPAAEVNGRLFLNNTSLGLYPAALRERERIYSRFGRNRLMAYLAIVSTILGFRRAPKIRVSVDGVARRRKTPLVFVARSAHQLEAFGLDGAGFIREGRFAVFLAPDRNRWGLLKDSAGLLLGGRSRPAGMELFGASEVVIEGFRNPRVALDGEHVRMSSPVRVRMRDTGLSVIVPQEPSSE